MKASALKNELNAALHFLKFVKRIRSLAVTDASYNATLENIKDAVSTFQVSDSSSIHAIVISSCLFSHNIDQTDTMRLLTSLTVSVR